MTIRRRLEQLAFVTAAVAATVAAGFAGAGDSRPGASSAAAGLVTRVVDGDTIDVRLASGRTERVRLIGIDAPERGRCWASQATAAAARLALNKRVTLRADATQATRDRYGRLLAYVDVTAATDLGRSLIRGGFGSVYVYDRPFLRLALYQQAEKQAKAAASGVWSSACGAAAAAATPGAAVAPVASSPSTTAPRTTTAATTTVAPPPAAAPATTSTAATASTAAAARGCDPAYPTVCIQPPPPDLDCKDVPYRNFKVLSPDPHRFDGNDRDGIGCES